MRCGTGDGDPAKRRPGSLFQACSLSSPTHRITRNTTRAHTASRNTSRDLTHARPPGAGPRTRRAPLKTDRLSDLGLTSEATLAPSSRERPR